MNKDLSGDEYLHCTGRESIEISPTYRRHPAGFKVLYERKRGTGLPVPINRDSAEGRLYLSPFSPPSLQAFFLYYWLFFINKSGWEASSMCNAVFSLLFIVFCYFGSIAVGPPQCGCPKPQGRFVQSASFGILNLLGVCQLDWKIGQLMKRTGPVLRSSLLPSSAVARYGGRNGGWIAGCYIAYLAKKVSEPLYNHIMWFWVCFGMADENGPSRARRSMTGQNKTKTVAESHSIFVEKLRIHQKISELRYIMLYGNIGF